MSYKLLLKIISAHFRGISVNLSDSSSYARTFDGRARKNRMIENERIAEQISELMLEFGVWSGPHLNRT